MATKKKTLSGVVLGRTPQRFLIVQKFRLGWYWRLQTAMPPKVGDKIANGGQPYNNKAMCIKMACSIIKGDVDFITETKGQLIYEVTNYVK